ncbi:MAG: hypothetical protein IT435_03320 [Phycisphaerales bacterium]|nr:hypothetical protein [Phycisphaerales bacterium]
MTAFRGLCFSPDSFGGGGGGIGGGSSGGSGGGGLGGSSAGTSTAGLPPENKPKIHGFGGGPKIEHAESRWKRPLNKNGLGATHVRTFHGKLTNQGMDFLDQHINDWLDAHPEAEVKFSTTQIGEVATATGKEQIMIVQIWI